MFYKKLLGTLILILLITGVSFTTYNFVDAKFINTESSLNFDGLVTAVTPSSLTLSTSGTEPIEVLINKKTSFVGKLKFQDIKVGDHLKINAVSSGGSVKAKTVKLVSHGSGYGTIGDRVYIEDAVVTSKNTTKRTITVNSGDAIITIQINISTNFDKTSFSQIKIGDELQVTGTDSGENFIAKDIKLKK